MSHQSDNGHLAPETFVDVLDGAPVDASHRQHLEGCEQCRAELDELRGVLSLITPRETVSSEADDRKRRSVAWLAAAAALLIAAGGFYWGLGIPEQFPEAAEIEEMLPPVEQDGEFQLLLALTDALGEEWDSEDASAYESELGLDPEGWTAEERQRFVEKLAEELRSSSS